MNSQRCEIVVDNSRLPVRDLGPRDGLPVILLHGLGMTADLCWRATYRPLASTTRVVAFDLRGHGAGLPVRDRFSLETCADDVIAAAGALGFDRFVAVGYSLGGLVAQMLWRRHPHAIAGLVLCATAHFPFTPVEWALHQSPQMNKPISADTRPRKFARHAPRADLWVLASAMQAAAKFDSRPWIHQIDIPTAVVIPTRDIVIIPWRQRRLAAAIPQSKTYAIAGGHLAPLRQTQHFADTVTRAHTGLSSGSLT